MIRIKHYLNNLQIKFLKTAGLDFSKNIKQLHKDFNIDHHPDQIYDNFGQMFSCFGINNNLDDVQDHKKSKGQSLENIVL